MTTETKPTGLALLREPFLPNQISKLPKPTKKQTDDVRADYKKGIRCQVCGTWHHPDVIHLDYVGHAALTDRLLDADPSWNWEYVAVGPDGNPVFDKDGGMWIRLTVCGVTRLGYGDAQEKTGGNATKERIGDALRNAAMRFGAALDLWHKGDLHLEEEPPKEKNKHIPIAAATADIQVNPEDEEYLKDLAASLVEDIEVAGNITLAFDKMEDAKLDSDQKLILWNILRPNSKTRSALKKEGEARRAAHQSAVKAATGDQSAAI